MRANERAPPQGRQRAVRRGTARGKLYGLSPNACARRYARVPSQEKAIFVYLLVSGALGLVFALCGRDRIRADGLFAMPAFGFVAMFASLVLLPGALYLVWVHPAWSWMYTVEVGSLSAALGVAWGLVHVGALLGGWALGGRLVKGGQHRGVVIAIAAVGAGILASVVALAERLAAYGTRETVAHGVGLGLMEVKLGYVLIVLAMAVAAAAAQAGLELARDSRRVRAR